MNVFDAAVALVKAGEHNAEEAARGFVSELEAHVEELFSGLIGRVEALETKIGLDAANGLSSLNDRLTSLEKAGGLSVDDSVLAEAISGLTAPPPAAAASTGADAAGQQAAGTSSADAGTAAEPQPAGQADPAAPTA